MITDEMVEASVACAANRGIDISDDARNIIEAAEAAAWQPMASAPKSDRILILAASGEQYVTHWVQHPGTGHEGYLVSQSGEDQHIINASAAKRWRPLPAAPKEGT